MTKLTTWLSPLLLGAAVCAAAPATASTTIVVNFDDLPGGRNLLVPDNYGGIKWGGNFYHYNDQAPGEYAPASGRTTIYPNYARFPVFSEAAVTFGFDEAVRFDGAFFSGGNNEAPVGYELFLNGVMVGATSDFTPAKTAGFFASGYAGLVDEVRIMGTAGFWVMDDVTYTLDPEIPPVPEPASWALMIGGFALAGGAMRRRHSVLAIGRA